MATKKPAPRYPLHFSRFFDNIADVKSLMDAHEQIAGEGRGRKRNVEVLNKSGVIFVVACWEVYVEDVVESALRALMKNAPDHKVFPEALLTRIGNKSQGPNAWKLAGDGWRNVLKDNLQEVLATTTGGLNTPKSGVLDDLYKKAIGMDKLSSHWLWHRTSAIKASAALDTLITLRGDIAHRVTLGTPVRKSHVINGAALVMRLAVLTHNAVGDYMHQRLGKRVPGWGTANLKSTSLKDEGAAKPAAR